MAEQAADAEVVEELEIIETPDGLPPAGDDTVQAAPAEAGNDDEDDEDERLGTGEDDNDVEITPAEKNRRKREKRRQAQQAKDRALDHLRAQNEAMAARLAALETNQLATSHMTLEQKLTQARATRAQADEIARAADEAGNTKDVIEAMNLRAAAEQEIAALEPEVRRLSQARAQPQQQEQSGPPREAIELQNAWRAANPWYRDDPNDQNSTIARAISNQLTADGLLPKSIDHWREVTRRLNEMAAANNDDTAARSTQRKGPPVNAQRSGAGGGGANGRKQVYLSGDRVQAMKDAGIWDDIPRRDAQIRAYQQWDRENSDRTKGVS